MPIWQKVPSYPVLQSQRNSFWRSAQVPSFTHGLEAHSLMSSPQVVPEKPGLHKQWVPPPSNSLHSPFPWHVCPVHSGISIYKNKQKAMCQPQGWYCKTGTPPWALDSPCIRGGVILGLFHIHVIWVSKLCWLGQVQKGVHFDLLHEMHHVLSHTCCTAGWFVSVKSLAWVLESKIGDFHEKVIAKASPENQPMERLFSFHHATASINPIGHLNILASLNKDLLSTVT